MILRALDSRPRGNDEGHGEWIVTRQIDHAEVAGQLAGHWGNEAFGLPIHRESVVLACGRHDEAWRDLDAHPRLNPVTSQPHSFLSMPLDVLLPAYIDGADRVGRIDPYAGFLVSMHYQGFFNGRFGLDPMLPLRTPSVAEQPRIADFSARMEQLRGRLRTMAAERHAVFAHATSDVVAHAYLLLQVVDRWHFPLPVFESAELLAAGGGDADRRRRSGQTDHESGRARRRPSLALALFPGGN